MLVQFFNSHWHDCSTCTGMIVQQSLAQLFNSCWHNSSTVTGKILFFYAGRILQQWFSLLKNCAMYQEYDTWSPCCIVSHTDMEEQTSEAGGPHRCVKSYKKWFISHYFDTMLRSIYNFHNEKFEGEHKNSYFQCEVLNHATMYLNSLWANKLLWNKKIEIITFYDKNLHKVSLKRLKLRNKFSKERKIENWSE